MKKTLLIIMASILMLGLSACSIPGFSQESSDTEKVIEKTVDKTVTEEIGKDMVSEDGEMAESALGVEGGSGEEGESTESEDKEDIKLEISLPQKILLILDASGSMWGQIDGKAKIDIAKDVVKNTVKKFEDTELGLMAYGHRRKGDCSDIEILANPKKNNGENISKMVNGISPKGMTPMGDSVLKAAESLKYTEQKATVILVSDGIETCDIDLCALGKKLEETGIDFTAHVIGFDMTEEQSIGLKCLANETGGKFMLAKDADSLSDALGEVVEASACSKEKLGEAIITAPKEVEVNTEFEVNWTGPNGRDDIMTILEKDDDNQNNHFDFVSYLDSKEGKVTLKAPKEVGEYDVVYFAECGTILGRFSLKTIGTSATLTIPETVSAGSEMTMSWTGPNNHDDHIGIFPKGETNWNKHLDSFGYLDSKGGTGILKVPTTTGEYDVVYWLGNDKIVTRKSFKVTDVVASITVNEEINIGSEFTIKWTGPSNKTDHIGIFPKGETNWNRHLDSFGYLDGKNGSGELTAPIEAGEYDVVYWLNQKKILTRKSFLAIEVSANLAGMPTSVSKESSFNVEWTGPNNHQDAITILPKGSINWNHHAGGILYHLDEKNETGELKAPKEAGEYDIVYWLNQKKILDRKTINVTN